MDKRTPRIFGLLTLFLLFASSARSQGMRYDNIVLKPLAIGGVTPVSGALITVCTSAGTGTPCTPKVANIYSDEALTVPIVGTGGAGTTNSDSGGNFGFYLGAGSYVVTVTGSGITSYTIKLVLPLGSASTNILWVGPGGYSSIAAAITAVGAGKGTIIIKSDYAGVECPAAVSINIQFVDWRGGNIICTQNVVTMNSVDATGVNALQRAVHLIKAQTLVATGSPVSYYDEMYLDNVNFNGAQADGGSSDLNFFGANSGTLTRASGNETETVFFGTASGNPSTGGSVTEATGGHGYVSTFAGSTTAINIATGYEAIGCATIAGSIPVQCFGLYARAQTTGAGGKGSSRSYSVATEGVNLAMYDANAVGGARSGWDLENSAHNVFPVLFNNSSDNVILRATGATGIFLQDSSANNLLQISPATVAIFGATTSFFPASVNAVDLGAGSNPFRNLYLGTAVTNNFKFQPAATAALRTVQILDPGIATTNLNLVDVVYGTYRVTTDFTLAANTSLQAITGLSWTMPANTALNVGFSCHLLYSQATAAVADQFGIQDVTVAPTSLMAKAQAYISASTFTAANVPALTTTTATPIVTFTPTAITTIWNADIDGMIEQPSNASTSVVQIMAQQSNAADLLTVKRGSFCRVW